MMCTLVAQWLVWYTSCLRDIVEFHSGLAALNRNLKRQKEVVHSTFSLSIITRLILSSFSCSWNQSNGTVFMVLGRIALVNNVPSVCELQSVWIPRLVLEIRLRAKRGRWRDRTDDTWQPAKTT